MSLKRELTVDAILPYVGEFGPFQFVLEVIFAVMMLPRTYHLLIMYFAGLNPDWRCAANSSICLLNGTISKEDPRRCTLPRSEWEYVKSEDFSIVTTFDISCNNEWMIELNASIFFIGWSFGAVCLGWAADNYGRRVVLFSSSGMILLIAFAGGFAPNMWLFTLSRFLTGFVFPGASINMFVMASELVGPRLRPTAGSVVWFVRPAGLMMLGLHAYYLRSWRNLYIILTAPYVFILLFWFFVPESVRWLHVHNRLDEATKVLKRVAGWNKRSLPENICLAPAAKVKKANIWDIFKTRQLAIKSFAQGYGWMVVTMSYYGLSLAAKDFGGDLYLNFILVSVVEFPAAILTILLGTFVGRKKTAVPAIIVGSIACASIAAFPHGSRFRLARLCLGVSGKLAVSIGMNIIHTWSMEVYPTTIRSIGMGYLQVTSRLGAIAAPFVARSLRKVHPGVPFLTMGVLGLTAGTVLLIVPETKDKATVETTKDFKELAPIRGNMEQQTACLEKDESNE